MTMDAERAIAVLENHNNWRRGADIPMQDPQDIGEAVDIAVSVMKEHGWRPISEAKKSPTSILVWCPDRQNQYIVTWMAGSDVGGGCWCHFGSMLSLSETPTHFQPLPPAPDA